MESIPQVMQLKPDKAASTKTTSVRDQEVEKCHLASGDPLSSTVFKESGETAPNSEEGDKNSADAESVASECSMESNASSNALNGDSQVSDADSLAPCQEKNSKRCPSGGSIVTYDEAASKLREEGECERTGHRQVARRSKGDQLNALDDDQDGSINAGQKMTESAGPAWTDDKHCSYLNSIEQTFVNSLYGQDFPTVDGSGQDDQDCVESRPMYGSSSHGCELFTSLQRGCYDQREYYRPQFLRNFAPSTSAIFLSPWIQHFNPKTATPSYGGAGAADQDVDPGQPSTPFVEDEDVVKVNVKEEVMESFPDLPETTQGPKSLNSRHKSEHCASTSAPVRADTGNQAKKRPCNMVPCNDAMYRPKKLKSTQRKQAKIDLEMEEQFVLEQKHLKELAEYSDKKAAPQLFDGERGGLDLNQALGQEEEETAAGETEHILPQGSIKTTDFITPFDEPTKTRIMEIDTRAEANIGRKPDLPKSHNCDAGEMSTGMRKFADSAGHNIPPGMSVKPGQDEANKSVQVDLGFDEGEELEFLLRRSPRASKTYTWGSVGPRRLLHNECNVLEEAVALSGNNKDSRDQELQIKGNSKQKLVFDS